MTTNCSNLIFAVIGMGLFCCLFAGGCGEVETHERAISREEALKCVSFPLPESTTNFFFYMRSGGLQYFKIFVRFDVDKSELHTSVDAIMAYNKKEPFGQDYIYPKSSISVRTYPQRLVEEAGLDWWDLDSVTKGYYRGKSSSHVIQVWADEEKNRIYIYIRD